MSLSKNAHACRRIASIVRSSNEQGTWRLSEQVSSGRRLRRPVANDSTFLARLIFRAPLS